VTNPTEREHAEQSEWDLVLDEGDRMRIRARPEADGSVTLWLSPARAYDLSLILRAYGRITAVVDESSQVSGTEDSLAHALRQASALARANQARPPAPRPPTTIIGEPQRLKATSQLQHLRPELSHSAAVSVIDAAAWWLEIARDYMAVDLLQVVVPDAGTLPYSTLIGHDLPQPPPAPSPTGGVDNNDGEETMNGNDRKER
jgi:hypothetical protein